MGKKIQIVPLALGEEIEFEVESFASSGDGIYHYNGYTLFVPGHVPGDKVRAEVVNVTPRFGVCRVLELLFSSPDRKEPECKVFHACGGCQMQHILYEKQVAFKAQVVSSALEKIGKIYIPAKPKFIEAHNQFGYRNRGFFALGKEKEETVVGFYEKKSHNIIQFDSCPILLPQINEIYTCLNDILHRYPPKIYDEDGHTGVLRKIVIRGSVQTKEFLIGLVTNKGSLPNKFIEAIKGIHSKVSGTFKIVGIVRNMNTDKTNIILGDSNKLLWGRDYYLETVGTVRYRLSLTSFFQVNPYQMEVLNKTVAAMLASEKSEILDAYCGIGSISLWLAAKGKHVTGVEDNKGAVRDAKRSAEENGITTAEFVAGRMEEYLRSNPKKFETVVLNPPRKGCSVEVIRELLEMRPPKIVYVSCNPATLARDLNLLDRTYVVKETKIIDMFPQTVHMETVVMMLLR